MNKPDEVLEMLREKFGYISMHNIQCSRNTRNGKFLCLTMYRRCVEKIEECTNTLHGNQIDTKSDLLKEDSYSEVMAEMVEELMEKQTVFDFCKKELLDSDYFDEFFSELIELYVKYHAVTADEEAYLNARIRNNKTKMVAEDEYIELDEFQQEFLFFFDEKLDLFLSDEKYREDEVGYNFARLLCTHLFCEHTVEELLDNPGIVYSAWRFIKETLAEDGYGYRCGELTLRVYKSEYLYGKEDFWEKASTPLKDVQEYPLIAGVLVSEKEKAVYLYLTEYAYFLEEVYDLSYTFLNLFIGVRYLEGGKYE